MSLLRDRRIAALLTAEVISSLGTQMTWLALPWFVLRTTGSPQHMTWVIIAEVLPVGVLGFWGGAIASRLGTRRTLGGGRQVKPSGSSERVTAGGPLARPGRCAPAQRSTPRAGSLERAPACPR